VGDVQCSLCVLQSLAMNGGFGLVQCRFAGVPLLCLLSNAFEWAVPVQQEAIF